MKASENDLTYVEVVTNEVAACCQFYESAYGWNFEPAIDELGGARVVVLNSGARWGIRAPMSEQEEPIVRTYIRVADIEEASRVATGLGGIEALGPTQLGDHGKVAIFLLHGIQQGIWEFSD